MKKRTNNTLKLSDICYFLGISTDEAQALIRAGEFPVMIKRGGIRVRSEDFFAWLSFRCYGGAA